MAGKLRLGPHFTRILSLHGKRFSRELTDFAMSGAVSPSAGVFWKTRELLVAFSENPRLAQGKTQDFRAALDAFGVATVESLVVFILDCANDAIAQGRDEAIDYQKVCRRKIKAYRENRQVRDARIEAAELIDCYFPIDESDVPSPDEILEATRQLRKNWDDSRLHSRVNDDTYTPRIYRVSRVPQRTT